MNIGTLPRYFCHPLFRPPDKVLKRNFVLQRSNLQILNKKPNRIVSRNGFSPNEESIAEVSAREEGKGERTDMVEKFLALDEIPEKKTEGFSENESMWNQLMEIVSSLDRRLDYGFVAR